MWRRRGTTWAAPPSGGEPVAEDDLSIVLRAIVDRRALAPLYEKYLTGIYRHWSRRLGDPDDAWDATGVTFHRALAALDGFRGGSFEGWLYRIADHFCLGDHGRRAGEAGGTTGGDRRPDGTIWVADARCLRPERRSPALHRRRCLAGSFRRKRHG